jgi:lysine-N-methylase
VDARGQSPHRPARQGGEGSRHPPAALSATTTRFASRFRCIGGDCEDGCCSSSWRIVLDQADYARLKTALAGSETERQRFERGCARNPEGGLPGRHYATLRRTDAGRCVFLEPEGLCAVQTAHGAAALPKVCATYPRVLTRIGDHLSLTAVLSCPEAARLCLLAGDALAREETDPGPLAPLLVRHRLPDAPAAPFVRHYLAIRDAFIALLLDPVHPVASRLHAAVHLARRLDAARAVARAGAQDARVREALAECRDPAVRDRLHRERRAITAPGPLPFALVQQVLGVLSRHPVAPRLAALVRGAGEEDQPAYRRARAAWEPAFAARVTRYTANYAANYWLREPFTAATGLVDHVLELLARVAAIRFLLFTHPALRGVERPDAADPGHGAALDGAAVDAVYAFSRAVDHGDGMREVLRGILAAARVRGRRRALELVGF